jgi:excisionase family DNA binding protein
MASSRTSAAKGETPMTPQTLRQLANAQRMIAVALDHEAHAAEQAQVPHHTAAAPPFQGDWIQDIVGDLPRLATVTETAKTLRMSARNVRRLVARGQLAVVRTGVGGSSRVLVARAEIARFLLALEGAR